MTKAVLPSTAMMKTEKFPVAQIYVPVKRRAALVQTRGIAARDKSS
jgi:hypothetical protein